MPFIGIDEYQIEAFIQPGYKIFADYNLGDGTYKKNYENIYELVNTYDGVNIAINHAKRRMAGFDEIKNKPSQYDPGTEVYKLVEQLKLYLE